MFIINYNGVNLLSNTSIWWRDVYILLLHREQLHVSALDNGHFRLYMNHLVSSYTNIYTSMGYLYGEGGGGRGSVRTVGTCGMHGGFMLLSSYV